MKLMLDLYSGLGGASEAFYHDKTWSILRYDNNPELRNIPLTTICDLKNYEIKCRHTIDVIWASPPCVDFSNAYNAPKVVAARNGVDYEPDMSLVERAVEIIQELRPKYWVIENVVGAIDDFKPLLGEPRQICGSFVLWGNFPFLALDPYSKLSKEGMDLGPNEPMRANIRTRVPLEISRALLTAIESQTNIDEWS